MAREAINIGTTDARNGDPPHIAFGKLNRMTDELYQAVDTTTLDGVMTQATDDIAVIANTVKGEYETVAASATAQALGATGAAGDFISHVLIIPDSTSPGAVSLLDNATSITIFAGGSNSVSSLIPFTVPLQMKSVSGAWKITTGANVSVVAVGNFT